MFFLNFFGVLGGVLLKFNLIEEHILSKLFFLPLSLRFDFEFEFEDFKFDL